MLSASFAVLASGGTFLYLETPMTSAILRPCARAAPSNTKKNTRRQINVRINRVIAIGIHTV